ncbi:hypothetical protein INT47_005338 [Mucor saturninus]|uniref:RRM domain-containing protein n=1 Tax=Mucor saturninus TaxID=64648 RepID=A0A8H7R8S7_9FUNG|nr:hypothetical protein INT47_005338 [Mucor saturninus]
MTSTWSLVVPEEATTAVLVHSISPQTTQETIRDFFSFCGIIKGFEMNSQKALVYFEQESAAKTAILLSGAVVDDCPIVVEPYHKAGVVEPITTIKAGVEEPITPTTAPVANKSVSHVMAELLASGYILTEPVVAKGVAFDEKHGVSTRVTGYFNKVKSQLGHQQQTTKSVGKAHSLFSSKTLGSITAKVSNVHAEAKRIAAEKKKPSQAS